MTEIAFALLALMLTVYVILDGYDLGIGAIMHLYGRTREERAEAITSIGPFWNGNEVWLIAAGAALFGMFPKAYASSFSGFYLPLTIVLWLLMGRGLALELRNHFDTRMWHEFWDLVFSVSSALLIVVFGVALGNLVRGLPLGPDGFFIGSFAILLNPYALTVGVLAVCILSLHGLYFVNMRVPWNAERHGSLARTLWLLVIALDLAVTVWTLFVHPLRGVPFVLAAILATASLAGLIGAYRFERAHDYTKAFLSSSLFIASLMVAAAVTIFPYIVPSNGQYPGISIYDAGPEPAALAGLLFVLGFGLSAVLIYQINVTRALWGPIDRGAIAAH